MADIELHSKEVQSPITKTDSKQHEPVPIAGHLGGQGRVHVVMVPGFGGFDALGQLRYYPRTTQAAADWRKEVAGASGERLVLHYFDNLPTAGVNTRANRLLGYLLDLQARNQFVDGDVIALVAHSTGGLDVRRLLQLLQWNDDKAPGRTFPELEGRSDEAKLLYRKIKRVVFLSVPQRGTNIATWVRDLEPWPMLLVAILRSYIDWLDFRPLELVESHIVKRLLPRNASLDVTKAVLDAFREAALRVEDDPIEAAAGREALAELSLFFNQTDGDFLAIQDLAVRGDAPHGLFRKFLRVALRMRRSMDADQSALAHANENTRNQELKAWRDRGIRTLSFATFASPGVGEDQQRDDSKTRSLLSVVRLALGNVRKTDIVFRLAYAACQAGPFTLVRPNAGSGAPDERGEGSLLAGSRSTDYATFRDEHKSTSYIRSWENDGIVNTASMLWPDGVDTNLVQGDHGDIIGHYKLKGAKRGELGRELNAYDIFGSDSGFDDRRFKDVWFTLFDFCLEALQQSAATPQPQAVA